MHTNFKICQVTLAVGWYEDFDLHGETYNSFANWMNVWTKKMSEVTVGIDD